MHPGGEGADDETHDAASTTVGPEIHDAASTTVGPEGHRRDIDGLRAIAIALVVAFHAGLPGFDGGFTGVDVFFVISGYLITRKLISEVASTGRVRLIGFWANRLRRLVPALVLMILVTLAGTVAFLPRFEWAEVSRQGAAASIYLSNVLFANQAGDYFGAELEASPFLHTWSLGVEEQFYLVWPVLLTVVGMGAAALGRRASATGDPEASARRLRRSLQVGFMVVLVASFALNLVQSAEANPWAFFGLATRAWEFAVAGLLATVVLPASLRGAGLRTGLAVAGLVTMVAGGVLLGDVSGYPGSWALVPVVGTALVLLAGDPRTGPTTAPVRALGLAPLQWVGRVSYSWYLWHWPAIVLAAAAIDDSLPVTAGAAALSLPVAAASFRFVENPVRFNPRLQHSRAASWAMGGAATAVALLAAFGVSRLVDVGATDLDTQLAVAEGDSRQYACEPEVSASGVEHCVSGALDSERTVMLMGDSHARHWKQALSVAAEEADVRLVDSYLGACPMVPVWIHAEPTTKVATCAEHRSDVRTLVDDVQPDLIIVSHSAGYLGRVRDADGSAVPKGEQPLLWAEAYTALLDDLEGVAPVALIRPGPFLPAHPLECIAREDAIAPCESTRSDALARQADLRAAEDEALDARGPTPAFDFVDVICDDTCHLELDGELVFSDPGHLTVAFTTSQVDQLVDLIEAGLDGTADPDAPPRDPPSTAATTLPLDPELAERLEVAADDRRQRTCVELPSTAGVDACVSGTVGADTTVLLLGDSHARHWKQALSIAAEQAGVELVDVYRGACPLVDVQLKGGGDGEADRCDTHRADVRAFLDELDPDVIVLAGSNAYESRVVDDQRQPIPRVERRALWAEAYADLVDELSDVAPLAIIRDSPTLLDDPIECITEAGTIAACERATDEVLEPMAPFLDVEREIVDADPTIATYDPMAVICDTVCRLEVGGELVFSGRTDLTTGFTSSQVDELRTMLDAALARSSGSG